MGKFRAKAKDFKRIEKESLRLPWKELCPPHYCRKHEEKKWKCEKCSKRYAALAEETKHLAAALLKQEIMDN